MGNIYVHNYLWLKYGLSTSHGSGCVNHKLVCDFLETHPEIAKDYNANTKFSKYSYYDILKMAEREEAEIIL